MPNLFICYTVYGLGCPQHIRIQHFRWFCKTTIHNKAWLAIQPECSDLRRTCAHLRQGTRKATNIKDIKRYLNVATIANDGLLVFKRNDPFVPSKELIIIPRSVLRGQLTSIHLQISPPSAKQMKTIMKRVFYALDMDKVIDSITSACSQCSALQKVPQFVIEKSTSDPPETVGRHLPLTL